MRKVFVLHHIHLIPGGDEDLKILGIYSSDSLARQAVSRFNKESGFRDLPNIVGLGSESDEGFHISEYELDIDVQGWATGYVSG